MSRAVVLASGGVDSAALLVRAASVHREVLPLYVRFGFIWENAELRHLKRLLRAIRKPAIRPLAVLDSALPPDAPRWAVTGKGTPGATSPDNAVLIPGRNAALLALAGIYAAVKRATVIEIGVLSGNPFTDATKEFFMKMSKRLSEAMSFKITVHAPFLNRRKEHTAAIAGARLVRLTFSCLNPRSFRPCGRCNKCAERKRGGA